MDIQSGVVGCGVFPTRLQVFVKVWTAQTRPAAHAGFLFNPKVPNKNAKGGAPSRPVGVCSGGGAELARLAHFNSIWPLMVH